MDLDLFYALATASVFLFCLSLLGKKLDKMVGQAKVAEKQRKVIWNLCAFLLMAAWFAIFWEFWLFSTDYSYREKPRTRKSCFSDTG